MTLEVTLPRLWLNPCTRLLNSPSPVIGTFFFLEIVVILSSPDTVEFNGCDNLAYVCGLSGTGRSVSSSVSGSSAHSNLDKLTDIEVYRTLRVAADSTQTRERAVTSPPLPISAYASTGQSVLHSNSRQDGTNVVEEENYASANAYFATSAPTQSTSPLANAGAQRGGLRTSKNFGVPGAPAAGVVLSTSPPPPRPFIRSDVTRT